MKYGDSIIFRKRWIKFGAFLKIYNKSILISVDLTIINAKLALLA